MQDSHKSREELLLEISELRRRVAELEAEKKFHDIIEQSNDGIVVTDEQGLVIEWNRGQEQITGLKRSAALGRPVWDTQFAIAPDEEKTLSAYEAAKTRILDALKTQQAPWFNQSLEHAIQRPDGARRFMQTMTFPIQTTAGFMIGSITRDITDQKQAENELRRYAARLKILYEIAQAILESQPTAQIAQAALDRLCELIPCQESGVFDFDFETNTASVLAAKGSALQAGAHFPLALPLFDTRFLQGHIQVIEDIEALPQKNPPERAIHAAGMRACIWVPLMVQGGPVGALSVGKAKPGPFAPQDIEIAREVADSLAVALQQTWLRDALQVYTEYLETSLREKEVLLKEVHHRVKNNLQVISSLLNLQANFIKDPQTAGALVESQSRIRSMALIHEKLYCSANLAQIDFAEYVHSLATDLFRFYRAHHIDLVMDIADISLDIDMAIPCGLIVNELVSNALKHAFGDAQRGEVRVGFTSQGKELILTVYDSGGAFSNDIDFRNTETLGLQLVMTLVDQLNGIVELDTSDGTAFKITFTRSS
ncbi:MAG: PAS domain S-box protein [Anaerolineae bacterium]|nr:PAS domain S-box protein [Anaerolineae bacterium]